MDSDQTKEQEAQRQKMKEMQGQIEKKADDTQKLHEDQEAT